MDLLGDSNDVAMPHRIDRTRRIQLSKQAPSQATTSKKLLSMPPTPFFAVDSEPTAHDITQFDPLFEAALALIEQQAVGVVWLDPDFASCFSSTGVVPSDLNIGEPISHSMIPLIGLDADLLALKTQKKREPLRLGNTALMTSDGHHSRRFNIAIFWDERRERFLVLLSMIFMQGSPIAETRSRDPSPTPDRTRPRVQIARICSHQRAARRICLRPSATTSTRLCARYVI